jgi:hypothetical protein
MIELLLPCGFDTLEYSYVKVTIGICMLADYSVAKKCQQTLNTHFSSVNLSLASHMCTKVLAKSAI